MYKRQPQHADAIAEQLTKIDIFKDIRSVPYDEAVVSGMITVMGDECDERFMRNVMAMANDSAMVSKMANDFKIVFTPFHGCGHKMCIRDRALSSRCAWKPPETTAPRACRP